MKNIVMMTLLFISLLTSTTTYAGGEVTKSDKILIVLTSHTELGNTGKKTKRTKKNDMYIYTYMHIYIYIYIYIYT